MTCFVMIQIYENWTQEYFFLCISQELDNASLCPCLRPNDQYVIKLLNGEHGI